MTKMPKALKKLGQHYLVDKNKQQLICQDFATTADVIIEVGPGTGALTQHLCRHKLPYWVIETDIRFIPQLQNYLPQEKIILQDALEFNWPAFLQQNQAELDHKKIWLVSNLPYNISVPLLLRFARVPQIQYMTLMFQLEVGQKLLSKKGEMNSLELMVGTQFDIKKLATLSPKSFNPPPKVDSIVLSFVRKETPIIPLEEWNELERFGRALFQLRRKQLISVLKMAFAKPIEELHALLESCEIDPKERAHNLSFPKVLALYAKLKRKVSQ